MLKKWLLVFLCLLLTGCSAATFETLGDIPHQQVAAPTPRKVVLQMPENSVQAVWSQEGDTMYLCENYTVYLQTFPGGDLNDTIRQLSGFERDRVRLMETRCADHSRYEWVWISAGEGGDTVNRCAVLSDGDFHYALTISADTATAGVLAEEWNGLMSSFCLEEKAQ